MKILIVDDSSFMRNMIKNALDGEFDISEASNADDAIKLFKENKPDLVFLDIILPGKNGLEALKEIKEIDGNAKVVMCSSVGGQEEIIDNAIKAGANDIIVKPFKKEEIAGIIQKVNEG